MKKLLVLVLLISVNAFSAVKNWNDLVINQIYKIDQTIELEKNLSNIIVPVNANLKFVEKLPMPMIKVDLYKFDISSYCSDQEFSSEIKLIDIKQPSGKIITIGADVAEDCILEIFVETKDTYTQSLFN